MKGQKAKIVLLLIISLIAWTSFSCSQSSDSDDMKTSDKKKEVELRTDIESLLTMDEIEEVLGELLDEPEEASDVEMLKGEKAIIYPVKNEESMKMVEIAIVEGQGSDEDARLEDARKIFDKKLAEAEQVEAVPDLGDDAFQAKPESPVSGLTILSGDVVLTITVLGDNHAEDYEGEKVLAPKMLERM